MKLLHSLALLAIVAGVAIPTANAADGKKTEKPKPYPLKTCIVAGDELDKDEVVLVYQGQEFKFCCDGCRKDFDKAPAKFVKKLADATAKK